MQTLRLAFMSAAALEMLATISVALVAVTVGIRLANGAMPLDTAMLAILLAPEAYWPIRRVGAEFHAAADGAVAIGDVINELAPTTPTVPISVAPGPATPVRPNTAAAPFGPLLGSETVPPRCSDEA